MSKIYGIGNDGQQISWQNTTFYKTIADPNSHPPNDATIRWYMSVTGLTYAETLIWQTWIVVSGHQRDLESLSESSRNEIKYGHFRITKDNEPWFHQSDEYKALYDLFQDYLTRKEEIRLLVLAASLDLDFSASPVSGTRPLTVSFTNLSEYADYYGWDFTVDGSLDSTETNPTHIYAQAGTYSVKLSGGNDGGTGATTKQNYITVYAPPSAAFSLSPTAGEPPVIVQFTNLSQAAQRYEWDFDTDWIVDSAEENPSYTYTSEMAAGIYSVGLSAYNKPGDRDVARNPFELIGAPTAVLLISPEASGWNAADVILSGQNSEYIDSYDPIYWENIEGQGPVLTPDPGYGYPFTYAFYSSAGSWPVNMTIYNKVGTSATDAGTFTIKETPKQDSLFSVVSAGDNPNMIKLMNEDRIRFHLEQNRKPDQVKLITDQGDDFFDYQNNILFMWFKIRFEEFPTSALSGFHSIFAFTNSATVSGNDLIDGSIPAVGFCHYYQGAPGGFRAYISNGSGQVAWTNTQQLSLNTDYWVKVELRTSGSFTSLQVSVYNNSYFSIYWPDASFNFGNRLLFSAFNTTAPGGPWDFRYLHLFNNAIPFENAQILSGELANLKFDKHFSDSFCNNTLQQLIQDDWQATGGGFGDTWGQSFVGDGNNLTSFEIFFYRSSGWNGTITPKLWSHSGEYGVSSVANSLIDTGSSITETSIPVGIGSATWVKFAFPEAPTLVKGKRYVISIDIPGDFGQSVGMGYGLNRHCGNICYGNNWADGPDTPIADRDWMFKINTGYENNIVDFTNTGIWTPDAGITVDSPTQISFDFTSDGDLDMDGVLGLQSFGVWRFRWKWVFTYGDIHLGNVNFDVLENGVSSLADRLAISTLGQTPGVSNMRLRQVSSNSGFVQTDDDTSDIYTTPMTRYCEMIVDHTGEFLDPPNPTNRWRIWSDGFDGDNLILDNTEQNYSEDGPGWGNMQLNGRMFAGGTGTSTLVISEVSIQKMNSI